MTPPAVTREDLEALLGLQEAGISKADWDAMVSMGVTNVKHLEHLGMLPRVLKLLNLADDLETAIQEFTANFGSSMSLKAKYFTTPNQHSASSLSKKPHETFLRGYGYLPGDAQFDGTHNHRVWESIVPDHIRDGRALPEDARDEPRLFMGEAENGVPNGDGTQTKFAEVLTDNNIHAVPSGTSSLESLGCGTGLVTKASESDFLWMSKNSVPYGVVELKSGTYSLLSMARQASGCASNVAIGLLNRGLERDEIIVPVVCCNGLSISFGATVVLPVSFPTFVPVSCELDLRTEHGRKTAMTYLRKINEHVQNMEQSLRDASPPPQRYRKLILLSDEVYYIKRLEPDLLNRSFRLLISEHEVSVSGAFLPGIHHMIKALNRLYKYAPVRPHVVFPLALRTPEKQGEAKVDDEKTWHFLVFPLLQGYRIGTPKPFDDDGKTTERFKDFLRELDRVVSLVHAAGVIHVDLYPSNYMWNEDKEDFDIKLIDWDVAHCLDEGGYAGQIPDCMEYERTWGKEHDRKFLELLRDEAFLLANRKAAEKLNATDKKTVDGAFGDLWSTWNRNRQQR